MSRLSSLGSNPTIREYAQGAAQEAVAPIADFIAPAVPVPVTSGKFKIYTAQNRFKVPDTKRAVGGRAVELAFAASDGTFDCAPHAIDVPVDLLEQAAQEDLELAMQEAADLAAEAGGLDHEKTVVDQALADAGTKVTQAMGADVDPIAFLDEKVLQVVKMAGYGSLMGIRIVSGPGAHLVLKNHPKVTNKFIVSGNNGPAPLAAITENEISQLLIAKPSVKTSMMVYDAAAAGKAADLQFLMDRKILIFAARENPTRRDPSFMKTFRLRGKFMVPGTYPRDDGRVEVAKFDWSEDVKTANSGAAILVTIP